MAETAKKLSFSMKYDLLERMDNYADENGLTRSGLIALAVTQYLNAMEAAPSVTKLLNAMAAVSDGVLKGEMPPTEARARLDAIQATYDVLSKK